MNSRRLICIIAAAFSAATIVSCSSTSPATKLIVGTWTPVDAEKYYEPGSSPESLAKTQDTTVTMTTAKHQNSITGKEKDKGRTTTGVTPEEQRQKMLAQWGHMVNIERRSGLVVKSDKTLQKIFKNRTVELTWKMKGRGKYLIAKEKETGQKYHVDIASITDSTLVLIEKLPQFDLGGVKVYYRRK
ncbi:MAG: hypothetical protein Q8867_06450 [Bacteroidota bacterium]|nr:hypothetical protein [Bacteroidota bacterium]